MKTTVYLCETNAANEIIYVKGNKALCVTEEGGRITLGKSTGFMRYEYEIDLNPLSDKNLKSIAQELKNAYEGCKDYHTIYDFSDCIDPGEGERADDVFDWDEDDYEQIFPIATINGSFGDIKIINDETTEPKVGDINIVIAGHEGLWDVEDTMKINRKQCFLCRRETGDKTEEIIIDKNFNPIPKQ